MSSGPTADMMLEVLLRLKISLWNGNYAEAHDLYGSVVGTNGPGPLALFPAGAFAEVMAIEGDLDRAARLTNWTLEEAQLVGLADHPGLHDTLRARAFVAYERGDLDGATADFSRALDLTHVSRRSCAVVAQLGLCRVHLAAGRIDEATAGASRARVLLDGATSPLADLITGVEVRVALATGESGYAERLLRRVQDVRRRRRLAVRVHLANGEPERASRAYARLDAPSTIRERIDHAALGAHVAMANGDEAEAGRQVDAALTIGYPHQFVRPLFEAGPGLAQPIGNALRLLPATAFTGALADGIEQAPVLHAAQVARRREGSPVLGARERAVLDLLARDHTYAEISAQLYISANTLKSHVRQIFRKLGAHSRDQAIVAAAALGLVAVPRRE